MTTTATPDLCVWTPYQALDLRPAQREHIAELSALQAELFTDGVWMGKTAALASAAAEPGLTIEPGVTRFVNAQSTAYRAGEDLHRTGPDGIPLAWSCWDVALTLALTIRERGTFKAFLLDAVGTESGARSEPHAVVGIQHRQTGERYLADPYFEVFPVPHEELVTAERDTLTSRAAVRGPVPFGDGTSLMTVQHISYAGAYSYVVADHLGDVAESRLLDTAPGWAVQRAQRVMRTRVGRYTVRVADDANHASAQVKVWDNGAGVGSADLWRWTYPTWQAAASAAVQAVSAGQRAVTELIGTALG